MSDREAPPERLVIIGGGPIGCELAQAFARLGSKVTQVEGGARLLPREDPDVSTLLAETLGREGVDILLNHEAVRIDGKALLVRHSGRETAIPFDEIILAVGRQARLEGYGLESLGIRTDRVVEVDPYLRTRFPNIFAVGDVAGPYQFTHFAAHQAWYAAVNALFGRFRRFRTDYSVLPWVTFTDPEVAHVGHNEASAAAEALEYEVVRYDLSHLDRAVAEGATAGFVKLLVRPGKDQILGATIAAHNAGEMIAELVLAMKHGIGLNKLLGTIKAYPTMSEANKFAAGEWKKAHKPERLLSLVERYHEWMRR
jgi:pyruvate/2-oxoglutarate dehydrogenase complex dihydrolipoamide dehydrogenase (E3) component